jgi:ParB family chromosome partitioning protein
MAAPGIAAKDQVKRVPTSRIQPSSLQPRKSFTEESLSELADSIRQQGILQPLVVRPRGNDFELIAGERRWRAAQKLSLPDVPILVREADDSTALEMMLVENLQRENLNPMEEALGYDQLMAQFQLRQEDIATKVGKNRATVANALRLLKLDPAVQAYLRNGQISTGHAKVILGLARADEQVLAAETVIKEGMSVRTTEELVSRWQDRGLAGTPSHPKNAPGTSVKDAHVADLENRLQQRFTTRVQLRYKRGKGSIQIHFHDDDELERVLECCGLLPE